MASAHKAIHNRVIHHLERRQDCSLPTDYPARCIQVFIDLANGIANVTPALLDGICEEACIGPLKDCTMGDDGLCVKQNDEYCYIITMNLINTCGDCNETCTDTCRLCLSDFVDDFSCCVDQYRSYSSFNITESEKDMCGNRYDTCRDMSGGAIAVPTVLTALLLMALAAIVV